MHLKTLTLAGFKSFADRTRIECQPGITVIVGPNGSGKSNIVDAIAWVMGTQATTSLRTQKMDDVIFAGTATRPALGRSEVSLTFDNSLGLMGIDAAEVTIGRRLFRDGTSEYEINGAPCRLLDVQELLADSGVGRHQHVIVGQGRIDDVLNAGPEDHRAVIEEAAGVIKHRRRRERTVARLEATDHDMVRARELLGEEERRLKPLKRQASAAERHEEVRSQWRALRQWVGGERLRLVQGRLIEIAALERDATEGLQEAISEREAITAALAEMHETAGEAGEALERDRVAVGRLETTAERLQSIALIARERRLGLERDAMGDVERRRVAETELIDIETQLAASASEAQQASEAADRAATLLSALDDEERSLAEADRLPAEGLAASLRGDLAALDAASRRDDVERADLTRRRGVVATLLDEEVVEAKRFESDIAALVSEIAVAARRRDAAAHTASTDRDAESSAETRWRSAEAAAAAAGARLEALEGAQAGFADAEARHRASTIGSVIGGLVDRLDVPATLLGAVTAALGPWADAFVAADRDSVAIAAGDIKSAGLGGVAFVAASASATVAARQVAEDAGIDALVDLLGPRADTALAATTLGDVLLVEGWAAARSVVLTNPHVRAVTPEGDLITAVGVVAAHPDGAGRVAVEGARVAAERSITELARARSQHATAKRASSISAAAERDATVAVDNLQRRHGGAEEAARLVLRSKDERQAEMDRLEGRLRSLAEAASARLERTEQMRARLDDLDGNADDHRAAWEDLSRRRVEVSTRRNEARHAHEEAARKLAAIDERRAILDERRKEMSDTLGVVFEPVPDDGAVALASIEDWARRAGEAVRGHVEALRERERSLRSQVGTAGSRLEEARTRRDHLGTVVESIREKVSALAVEGAELRVREEAAAESLRREVDTSEADALAAPRPELAEGTDPDAHLETLAATLRRLGPINPLAAEEYREVSEKVAFMQTQLEDLETSRSELRKVIRALDEEIGRLFVDAFDEISATFADNFSLLFPGGTGRLSLTTPGDPMTSGVDIHAQPMGKKVSRLALLSGGERSLAALAFLFAVFKARPSPFYVLDEVEAALDDANLHRFIRLVDGVRSDSQLLIVTHQQQTMEAGDVLYGVTMEPGGSSRVLAKRFAPV